jgi:hypothetical protein
VVLPYNEVRNFATFFFKLKSSLLEFEINQSSEHPARWEKKGSALYTVKNVQKSQDLRNATFRLLNKIKKVDGFIFYVDRTPKIRHYMQHDEFRTHT